MMNRQKLRRVRERKVRRRRKKKRTARQIRRKGRTKPKSQNRNPSRSKTTKRKRKASPRSRNDLNPLKIQTNMLENINRFTVDEQELGVTNNPIFSNIQTPPPNNHP